MGKTTICVLTYGDHPEFLERCMVSIMKTIPLEQLHLRIAMNAPSERIRSWVNSWADFAYVYDSAVNVYKYPMMRQLLYGDNAVDTPYFMWFDDDSYLRGFELTERTPATWLDQVESVMEKHDLIGAPFTCGWQGRQREWVQQQPWYTSKPFRPKIGFCVGGWWCARTDKLREIGYPWLELNHNGGDTMLGEAAYQQGWRVGAFRAGVVINADLAGAESKAPRRGHLDKKPLGA